MKLNTDTSLPSSSIGLPVLRRCSRQLCLLYPRSLGQLYVWVFRQYRGLVASVCSTLWQMTWARPELEPNVTWQRAISGALSHRHRREPHHTSPWIRVREDTNVLYPESLLFKDLSHHRRLCPRLPANLSPWSCFTHRVAAASRGDHAW